MYWKILKSHCSGDLFNNGIIAGARAGQHGALLGVGIRFFGAVRFGFLGLVKIRFSIIKNRSVLQNLKNRHRS